jgi:hypothetical protein
MQLTTHIFKGTKKNNKMANIGRTSMQAERGEKKSNPSHEPSRTQKGSTLDPDLIAREIEDLLRTQI